MPSIRQRLATYLFPDILQQTAQQAALSATRDPFPISGATPNAPYDFLTSTTRLEQQADVREAWARNPYAHRIIDITTAHILGRQLSITSTHPDIDNWIQEWWAVNEIELIIYDLIEEILRTGEWLHVLAPDPYTGMQWLTPIPSHWLTDVHQSPANYRYELGYTITTADSPNGKFVPNALNTDRPDATTAVYYAINRPLGSPRTWGGILMPVLPAIERYNQWLSDRAATNNAASKYAWDVTAGPDRLEEVKKLFAGGVPAGSVYVHTPQEGMSAAAPQIASWDARHDGQAMRQAIATGSNTAMHMLGDVTEGSRAGAREAAMPSYRIYGSYQNRISAFLKHLTTTAVTRAHQSGKWRRMYNRPLPNPRQWGLTVQTADLTRDDNATLATATQTITNALATAVQHNWIDDQTATEWLFRFAGENYDPETLTQRLKTPLTDAEIQQAEAAYLSAMQQYKSRHAHGRDQSSDSHSSPAEEN